jgi:hypothetical protein
MELLTATRKRKVFLQLEMFNLCTTGDMAHIDTIFKFLPHMRQHRCIGILHCCNDPCLQPQRGHVLVRPIIATWPRWPKCTDHCSSEEYRCTIVDACVVRTWISYRCVPCHPWFTHRTSLVVKKTFEVFVWLWTIPLRWVIWFSCYKCLQSLRTLWNTPYYGYVSGYFS